MAAIAPSPDKPPRMPEMIAGKYEVLQTIGRGGMGTVYKAVQRNLDRVVAIKMLSEELASDPEFRARFQQEATVVARLSHPNIVAVHDIEPHNHTFCIIMEFLEGENLQAKIDRDVTLPERDVVLIGAQVARALGYAHNQGIIHRDVKPDNIHVTPQGVAKVMDFGIARFLDSKLKTQTGISMGTPKFMSPEQVTGKNVDGQTDLYSLGVCLYYCMAGRPPFDGENAIAVATRHLYEQPEPPSRFNTSISPAVEKVIMRALEKQKAERYTTGFDMADALEGTLGIRSPIRISDDSNAGVYSGATQRISLQAVGGGVADIEVTEPLDHTPGGSLQPAPASGRSPSPRGEGWSNVTPVPMRSMSDGMDNFVPPVGQEGNSGTGSQPVVNPAVAIGKWWPALVAFIVLGIGAAYLAFVTAGGSGRAPNQGPAITDNSAVRQFEQVDKEAQALAAQRQYKQAYQKWTAFQAANRDYQPAAVEQKIDQLTNLLPVTEADVLGKRRKEKGLSMVNSREPVAAAYLQGALDLDPQGSKLVQSQLKQLQSLIETRTASEAELRASQEALQNAKKLSSGGSGTDIAQAEDAYLQSVTLHPRDGNKWLAVGDFYASRQLLDDARVMYAAAAQYDQNPDIKRESARKLAQLNQ